MNIPKVSSSKKTVQNELANGLDGKIASSLPPALEEQLPVLVLGTIEGL